MVIMVMDGKDSEQRSDARATSRPRVDRRAVLTQAAWVTIGTMTTAASLPSALAAQPTRTDRAGTVDFVSGETLVTDGNDRRKLTVGSVVYAGQMIETGQTAEVHVVLDDGGFLAVRPQSRIQFDQAKISGTFDDSLTLTLFRGAMRSITGWVGKFDKSRYKLHVGTATIGIRGTDHEVVFIPSGQERPGEVAGIHNWVNEGGTSLQNSAGTVEIESGRAGWLDHHGNRPQLHADMPTYLRDRRSRYEARIAKHASRVREHIETRMRKRGMLKRNERLEDAQARHATWRERLQNRTERDPAQKDSSESKIHPEKLRQQHREHLRDRATHGKPQGDAAN